MRRTKVVLLLVCLTFFVLGAAALAQEIAFPRDQTLIVNMLTGRVGTPSNFNEWVSWRWRDRGMQNLANEPLWSVDFATGQTIAATSGDPCTMKISQTHYPLRAGVAWSDGVPFTADDVVFDRTIIAEPGLNSIPPLPH